MKTSKNKTVKALALFFMGLIMPLMITAQDILPQEGIARKFLDHLVNKEVNEMLEMFSEGFLEQVPREQITEIAHGLEQQLGGFRHVKRVVHEAGDPYATVILVCLFGETELGVRITLDRNDKVAGFFITMAPPEAYTAPPCWIDSSSFSEIPMEVDCDDIRLQAMLSMPVQGDHFPAVILVHGSGAHDMDESIGPNKIFRDIAWGLASQGIAVLRYEKRSFRHHHTIDRDQFTVWDEAGQDAVYAIQTVMKQQGINTEQVYLLGHSLGGMIAPRIAQEVPQLAGIISLAGSPRQLYEIIPGQLEYLMSLEEEVSESAVRQLEETREIARKLSGKRNDPGAVYESSLLGMPPSYLADMNRHNTGSIAAGLPQRIFILHGARDYQVTMEDYNAWKDALANHPRTTFKLYPSLNHLFFPGEGPSSPAEYFLENNVDKSVIDDMAG